MPAHHLSKIQKNLFPVWEEVFLRYKKKMVGPDEAPSESGLPYGALAPMNNFPEWEEVFAFIEKRNGVPKRILLGASTLKFTNPPKEGAVNRRTKHSILQFEYG